METPALASKAHQLLPVTMFPRVWPEDQEGRAPRLRVSPSGAVWKRFQHAGRFALAFAGFLFTLDVQGEAVPQNTLGWDLTYSSVMQRNNVKNSEFSWLYPEETYESPVASLLKKWDGAPIVASILIEFPIGHGSGHGVLWLARTNMSAFYHFISVGPPNFRRLKEEINTTEFDDILRTVGTWQQLSRKSRANSVLGVTYYGFLSVYDGQTSRQILLTMDDLILTDDQGSNLDKPGRVLLIVKPFLDKLTKAATE
jgi:hypothetical protein